MLLSFTAEQQQFISTWDHLSSAARTDLAVLEYRYPQFATEVDAILQPLGLAPIAPQDGTLVQFPAQTNRATLPKPHHHKPTRRPKPHRPKQGPTPPSVTGVTYAYDQALPNDLIFSLSEGINVQNSNDWPNTISVINLDTGAVVPATAENEPGVPQLVYHLNNNAELADANYAAVLHGAHLSGLTTGLPLAGSPGAPGDDFTYDFWFRSSDFDHDPVRSTNSADLQRVLYYLNTSGRTFSQGDSNYDGNVNSLDLAKVLFDLNTLLPLLGAPGNPTVTAIGNTTASISWPASSDPSVTAYDVYRFDSTGAVTRVATDTSATSFSDSGLSAGLTYDYVVVSKNQKDDSSYPSNEVAVRTAPITIQPIATQTVTEGDAVTVSASFSDAGPLTTHTGQVNWGDTTSDPATIVESNNSGTASGTHTYTIAGSYFGSVLVSNPNGASTSDPFEVIVGDAPLSATGAAITATQHSPFSGEVADLNDADLSAAAYKYTASIDWGDGTGASAGTIVDNGNGDFSVNGDHTYTSTGTFNLTVTIDDTGGASTVADGQADVAPPPPQSPSGLTAADVSNQEIDLTWSPDPSGYSAGYNIYASTDPSFTPGPDNLIDFGVSGTTYKGTGLDSNTAYYFYVTSVNSASEESAPSNEASATTAHAQLTAVPHPFTVTEGEQYDGVVASFTDNDINADPANYTAFVSGPSGQGYAQDIEPNTSGGFDVIDSLNFPDAVFIGNLWQVLVTVQSTDRTQVTIDSPVTVNDAAIQADATTINATSGTSFSGVIANFTDDDARSSASDFTATVTWGDGGATPAASVNAIGNGQYSVDGSHIYGSPGTYTIQVNIVDAAGSTAAAASTAVVTAPLPASANNPTTLQNTSNGLKMGVLPTGELYGLTYLPTGGTALDAGDESEGWGVADANTGVSGYTRNGTPTGLSLQSFTATASTAVSTVLVGSSTQPTFEVSEDFHPIVLSNGPLEPPVIFADLYEMTGYITNMTANPVHLLYRRTMDWDVNSLDSEYVSNQQYGRIGQECIFDSNDDAQVTDDPLGSTTVPADSSDPNFKTGTFSDSGPGELGAVFQFDFGTLAPHVTQVFKIYYGAAASEGQAESEIDNQSLDATWSVARPSSTTGPQSAFMFGFLPLDVISLDMNIDANNDGVVNASDEPLKDSPTGPGKVIIADTLNRTDNNKPGYADWSIPTTSANGDNFAAITISAAGLPGLFDLGKANFRFVYSSADPALVTAANVGSDIPRYDPGSSGALRLWLPSEGNHRVPASVLLPDGGGDYIPADTVIPSSLLFNGESTTTVYAEGINPTDPGTTRVEVDVDPEGNGKWILRDYVRLTVAKVQLVYTDVSGFSYDVNGWSETLGVPRIDPTLEPEGVACDWKAGVDDGAMILMSLVASPAVISLSQDPSKQFSVDWGITLQTQPFQPIWAGVGTYWSMDEIINSEWRLNDLSINTIGQQWQSTGLAVLDARFYRPPDEFAEAAATTDRYDRFDLGVNIQWNGQVAAQGGKPEGLMLTRPPLVLVHGIDSGPSVWDDQSGGQSFDSAMAGYPTTFKVDHRSSDPQRLVDAHTYGEGEISDMYIFVRNEIGSATAAYRAGQYFPSNPYATRAMPTGALIADQKADVVAHSYGGLLTRWYVEQSPEFSLRRDVRKVIELGTPNLGSPLANMVDEILRNPVIANASENFYTAQFGIAPLFVILKALDTIGTAGQPDLFGLPTMMVGRTPYPFFEDASVDSPRMEQLNLNPFNNDVAYAAVVGTNPVVTIKHVPVNLYTLLQPTDTTGGNYYPWLGVLDGTFTDGIVPTWSASLGVAIYNSYVPRTHIELVQDATVQDQVLEWLNDPQVPLGSAQRAAWTASAGNQPPVSDRNAYEQPTPYGTDAQGRLTGGGVNPNAIVGVSFSGTGMSPVSWDSGPTGAGIHLPTLTGMVQVYSSTGSLPMRLVTADHSVTLNDLGKPILSLSIDPAQFIGAGQLDYVAFSLALAPSQGGVGRRHDQVLTGPSGAESAQAGSGAAYYLPGLPGFYSPATKVTITPFTLPLPSHAGLTVNVSGSVECVKAAAGSQTSEVDLYSTYFSSGVSSSLDTKLAALSVTIVHPAGIWDGVLLPYATSATLLTDVAGNVYGPQGSSGEPHPHVYQYLREHWGVSNYGSISVGL